MKKTISSLVVVAFLAQGCKPKTENQVVQKEFPEVGLQSLTFRSSDKKLDEAFGWAKDKALSYAHDGSDPVGAWYEAALPNREAFCMRDVSHQAIGAELLGLGKHNLNMFLKFAQNISPDMDYCSYWEINRHDLPAPVDYENEKDFWYNLPANFDVIYNAYRLYNWTGNRAYLENEALQNFYELSMNEYVDHWDLGHAEVLSRNRGLHEVKKDNKRFDGKRGIPTYNEGGRGETALGIDMTASLISAYNAYSRMLDATGNKKESEEFRVKAEKEQKFLEDFWWDAEQNAFRSILYGDGKFDYFMVGDDQAFLHYLLYFDALLDPDKIKGVVDAYAKNFGKLIVELKSYLPIIFYENGQTTIANQMVINLCSAENARRDYPENSFTVIEHLTRGLMGIDVEAASNTFLSLSRVEDQDNWAEMKNIPILSNKISVMHEGNKKTIAANQSGPSIRWSAQMLGQHEYLFVNNARVKCTQTKENGNYISYCTVTLEEGKETVVSLNPL